MAAHARRLALAALLLAAVLLAVPAATAHARLHDSSPESGARLESAPTRVFVTLTEAVEPDTARLRVLDQTGTRVDNDDLETTGGDRPTLTATLRSGLGDGAYRILWSALSADTHPVDGVVGFAVGDFEPPASSGSGGTGATPPAIVGRVLVYAGIALALGGLLFHGLLPAAAPVQFAGAPPAPPAPAPASRRALVAGANLHLGGIALLTYAYLSDSPLAATDALRGDVGRILLVRLLLGLGALALLLLGLGRTTRHPSQEPLAATFLAAAGVASALMGHPVVQGVGVVAVDAIHLLAGLMWAGGLAVFLWCLAREARGLPPERLVHLGVRFGTVALLCVVALFATGAVSAVAIAGWAVLRDPATFTAPWRLYLSAKILLALAMVALAAVNRYVLLEAPTRKGLAGALQARAARWSPRLRPLLAPGSGPGALARTLRIEAALGAAVLVLAALLASVSPPAAAVGSEDPDALQLSAQGDAFRYALRIDPAPQVGGSSEVAVRITDLDGQPLRGNDCGSDACVELHVADPASPQQQEAYVLVPDGNGTWLHGAVLWSRAGATLLTLHAASATVFQDSANATVTVAS